MFFLISKASAKLSQILSHGTNKREEARMRKSEQVFTFLVHKNQLPFFFLCAKYGLKQIQLVENNYDKNVQQSFLFQK